MAQTKKEIKYLNKDFSQFRENLIEYAKNYFPNTYNDFNESSPGMMFMEMASYVGDVLSYYTDNQLKESFLQFAGSRGNVLALAANVGYKQKNKIPATVDLDVLQLIPAKSTKDGKVPDWDYALTVQEGMVVKSEDTGIEFRTLSLINFKVSSSFDPTDISIYQISDEDKTPEFYLLKKRAKAIAGQIKTATYTFGAAKRFDKILIEDTDAIEIVSVIDSDLNTWTEVPYLAQDTVYESVANTVAEPANVAKSLALDIIFLSKIGHLLTSSRTCLLL